MPDERSDPKPGLDMAFSRTQGAVLRDAGPPRAASIGLAGVRRHQRTGPHSVEGDTLKRAFRGDPGLADEAHS